MDSLETLIASVKAGEGQPFYLVSGDRVVAEPAALRLGEALAEKSGCRVEVHRRPAQLSLLLADLRTYSLFAPAKVIIAVETAVVADKAAAAELVDEAIEVLPLESGGDLSPRERQAAGRLLQTLHLFQIDAFSGSAATVLGRLPAWSLQGGQAARGKGRRRGRSKRQVEELREQLGELLERALESGLQGGVEGELVELAAILDGGLPPEHSLILAESRVASEHPLVGALDERRAHLKLGRVEARKGGGWSGLELLAGELERETGVGIEPGALRELAQRTVLREAGWGSDGADADSTARLAGEYRKLAATVAEGRIGVEVVRATVVDRGQEDVWGILDAIGEGRGDAAESKLRRYLAAVEDPVGARLSFFALLANFARHLSAIGSGFGGEISRGERNYSRFKSRIAPMLQGELPGGAPNPLDGIHPFRLHRAYLAASRLPAGRLERLPWMLLQTELRLKGESGDPEAALAALISELSRSAESSQVSSG